MLKNEIFRSSDNIIPRCCWLDIIVTKICVFIFYLFIYFFFFTLRMTFAIDILETEKAF